MCAQSCLALCDPMDCSPPGFSVHGIFQVRVLEWGTISFSRGSCPPRDWTHVSCIGRWVLYHWAIREAPSHLLEWPKSKTLAIPNAGRDLEPQERSYIAGRNAKWYSHFRRQLGSFLQSYILTIWSCNFIPWYLSKWVKNFCPHNTLYTDVYSSFIHNCQHLEATKMPFNRWTDK